MLMYQEISNDIRIDKKKLILLKKGKIKPEKTLDLHGLKHEHVYRIVDQFIGGHIIKRTSEISIITGRSIKMKEIVSEILTDYHNSSKS